MLTDILTFKSKSYYKIDWGEIIKKTKKIRRQRDEEYSKIGNENERWQSISTSKLEYISFLFIWDFNMLGYI